VVAAPGLLAARVSGLNMRGPGANAEAERAVGTLIPKMVIASREREKEEG
jgi:hypothetical protein